MLSFTIVVTTTFVQVGFEYVMLIVKIAEERYQVTFLRAFYNNAAPNTPALSPNFGRKIGVSKV